MIAADTLKVGWCPGALRPMESGDGFIVRVKPSGGILSLDRAEALARLSLRYGNGHLDVTGRANLQIRGVTDAAVDTLIRDLGDLGLLDESPEAEAVRNIVASPLAGLDRGADDIGPVVAGLEACLAQDARLHRLPPKWSFVIDDGDRLPLSDVAADVRFVLGPDRMAWVGLDGDPSWAVIAATAIVDVAAALSRLALALAQPMRMRQLVQFAGAAPIFERIGLSCVGTEPPWREPVPAGDLLGHHAVPVPFLGFAPAFASLGADDLLRIVEAARQGAARDLRLTPWRVMLVTDLHDLAGLLTRLMHMDVVLDPADPRQSIAACTGAPACHRATTPTRRDAADLAKRLGSSRDLIHISGCAKGCARPTTAAWTLVGQGGRYDLVRNGTAQDAPLARGLTFDEAASWLSRNNARTA